MHLTSHCFPLVSSGPFLPTPNHTAIAQGANMNGVWVPPANHLVTGKLIGWAAVAQVTSVRVPGYWIHARGSALSVGAAPQPGEKVVYQLHGGAYVRLSAYPRDPTANISKGYVAHLTGVQRVFSVEYRLASAPPYATEHPFPTQLLDALAGYAYLVGLGFAPADIVVSGDSAGANLVLALTRYLVEYADAPGVELPAPPGALILLSPWADIGSTTETLKATGSVSTNLRSDYIRGDDSTAWAKAAFTGPHGISAADTNEYISPASLYPGLEVDFGGFPRTFIVAGGAEVLYDSIVTLRERMAAGLGEGDGVRDAEGKVRWYEVPDGVHDYLVFTWHEPERTETFKAIDKWLNAS